MKLFSRKYGSGPPLIIAHGLYGSSDNWVTVAKMLAVHFEVFLVDQRNHGNSPRSDEHGYSLMKDDLLEFMDDQNIKKAILTGHSMGGKTVSFLAVEHPERTEALIVADILPVAYPPDSPQASEHMRLINSMLSVDISGLQSREDAEEQLRPLILDDRIRGFLMKNLHRDHENHFLWKINLPVLKNSVENLMSGLDEKDFENGKGITGFPVLFLRGAKSGYIPVSSFPVIRKIFPMAEIVTIPDAGHWLHAEQPALLVKNILYFLGIN